MDYKKWRKKSRKIKGFALHIDHPTHISSNASRIWCSNIRSLSCRRDFVESGFQETAATVTLDCDDGHGETAQLQDPS